MNETFDALAARSPDELRTALESALGVRAAAPARSYLAARTPELDAADFVALLEWVEPQGEEYRFALVRRTGAEARLATNAAVRRDDEGWVLEEAGDVRVFALDPDSRAHALARGLESVEIAEGVGGQTGVFDGATDLLTLGAAAQRSRCILYGYDYPILTEGATPPASEPDRAHHQAIHDVLRLLVEVLASGAEPVETEPVAGG
jgi:hypothetical protein